MSFKIKKIKAKNIGPITELDWELDDVNLVFGHNEKGKSYLVEFLVHSLFKTKNWSDLRQQRGQGQIYLENTAGQEQIFSPDQDQKLETLLAETRLGLPPDFSKLLVFRSIRAELGSGQDKTDRAMLRRFLSHQELLGTIRDSIKKTVQQAEIDGYRIDAENRGIIKERSELKKKLNKFNELFAQLEQEYLGSELYELKEKEAALAKQRQSLATAKRYQAYQLRQELDELQTKANQIKVDNLSQLQSEIKTWRDDVVKFKRDQVELEKLELKTKHYLWLESALKQYQELSQTTGGEKVGGENASGGKPNLLWLSSAFGLLILAGGVFFTNLNLIALLLLTTGIGLAVYYYWLQNQYLANFGQSQELDKLKTDFTQRFEQNLTSLATLEATKKDLDQDDWQRKHLTKVQAETKQDLETKKLELETQVEESVGQSVKQSAWLQALDKLKQKHNQLQVKIKNQEIALIKLNVAEAEFVTTQPKQDYSPAKEAQLQQQQEVISHKIDRQENTQRTLKQRLCDQTGENIATPWQDLITALSDRYQQEEAEYQQKTAQIIAQRQLTTVIEELLETEDEKITQVLESDLIRELLPQVTTHYQDLELKNETLFVTNGFSSFPVHELSAGAREQVFLTLRIALASQWFQAEKMFLILDDAFIHSDQIRKEALIKNMLKLGQAGWQIICFSFDERIKELFAQHQPDYNLLDLNERQY